NKKKTLRTGQAGLQLEVRHRNPQEGEGTMKWYHWVFIVALQLFINALTLVFIAKNIKVVSFMEITAMGVDEMARAIQSGEDPQKLQQMQMEKLKQIQEKIGRQSGIVLIKECVVKGPFEDITYEVLGR
ncbi:hypothetical protein, partial [Thermocrinis sp.]|uniref:hypothetical protein n=1 Tax=Thermocrinis sp. TaxID=2024383 RepID=UPI003C05D1B7